MAGPVLGWPVQEIPGECVAIEALWGSAARRWEDRLGSAADAAGQRAELECLVAERVAAGDGPDRLVIEACRRLSSSATSVEDIATALAVSGRELRRRFRHSVGYGPKALQRVLRFQRFVSRLGALAAGETTLAALAVGVGYADQAHLCRECQTLSGSSPRSLLACWTA